MPKLGLFATGGYGKTGLNTFNSDFRAFFVGGIMLSWNFGKLNTLGNDRKLIRVQQESVELQKESFLFNNTDGVDSERCGNKEIAEDGGE